MTMNQFFQRLLTSALVLLLISPAVAQVVPENVHFQAYITDSEGVPLSGEQTLLAEFYDGPGDDATLLWSQTIEAEVENGLVSLLLGDQDTPLDFGVFASDGPIFFQVSVNGEAQEPRFEIAAVPFAMWAANVPNEEDVREGLADSLLPTDCSDLERAQWNDSDEVWDCVAPVSEAGPSGPSGPSDPPDQPGRRDRQEPPLV